MTSNKERPSSATSSSDRCWSPGGVSLPDSFQRLSVGNAVSLKERLTALSKRSGYPIVQENGQRKYGPPLDWQGDEPPRGCEIFIGKLPRDMMEDEIIPVFERVGKLYRFRLMLDFSGTNRGFAFAKYTNKESAKRAVAELDNYQIRRNRHIGVVMSVDNCRLYLGRIPRNKTTEEVYQEISKMTEGVVRVILYPNADDKTKNRGFAFIEYCSHQAATMARRRLIPGQVTMWGVDVEVDWAEPEQEPDEEILAKVKNLYVRNLMSVTTEKRIKELFESVSGLGTVEHVKKMKDYAFVHFTQREYAIMGLTLNGITLDGAQLEVVWAKPVDRNLKRIKTMTGTARNLPILANVPQSLLTGANPMLLGPPAAGVIHPQAVHMPMVMPPLSSLPPLNLNAPPPTMASPYAGMPFIDPNAGGFSSSSAWIRPPNGRNRSAAGMRSAVYHQASFDNAARRNQRKYSEQSVIEEPMVNGSALTGMVAPSNGMVLLPSPTFMPVTTVHFPLTTTIHQPPIRDDQSMTMMTTTSNLTTITTAANTAAPNVLNFKKGFCQMLEDYCKANNWSPPEYHPTVITTKDGAGRDVPLYVFKVTIPELVNTYGHFERRKSNMNSEEAREDAAQFVLLQIGFPFHQMSAVQ